MGVRFEREVPTKHAIQDYSARSNVLFEAELFPPQYFRSCVLWVISCLLPECFSEAVSDVSDFDVDCALSVFD